MVTLWRAGPFFDQLTRGILANGNPKDLGSLAQLLCCLLCHMWAHGCAVSEHHDHRLGSVSAVLLLCLSQTQSDGSQCGSSWLLHSPDQSGHGHQVIRHVADLLDLALVLDVNPPRSISGASDEVILLIRTAENLQRHLGSA